VGGSKGSLNGELESGTESVMELSVEGIDVPVEGVEVPVDEGVIVVAQSQETNRPLTRGWSLHEMLGTRMFLSAEDEVI